MRGKGGEGRRWGGREERGRDGRKGRRGEEMGGKEEREEGTDGCELQQGTIGVIEKDSKFRNA